MSDVTTAEATICDNCELDIEWLDWQGLVGGPAWVHCRTKSSECRDLMSDRLLGSDAEPRRQDLTTVRSVPVDPALAEKLRRAAGKIDHWTTERDRLIVEARRAGASSREVAELVGLTHAGVLHIEKRAKSGPDAEPGR